MAKKNTYAILVRDEDGRWQAAPGNSSGMTLKEAKQCVSQGIESMNGEPFRPEDIRIQKQAG